MKRVLVCTGVLGGGTAVVFALAAATALAFPNGTRVAGGWNNVMFAKPMPAMGMPVMLDDTMFNGVAPGGAAPFQVEPAVPDLDVP